MQVGGGTDFPSVVIEKTAAERAYHRRDAVGLHAADNHCFLYKMLDHNLNPRAREEVKQGAGKRKQRAGGTNNDFLAPRTVHLQSQHCYIRPLQVVQVDKRKRGVGF